MRGTRVPCYACKNDECKRLDIVQAHDAGCGNYAETSMVEPENS